MLLFCILGFLFVSIVGALCHFVFDWTKHNKFFGIFVAVNESTWEHIKLAIFPTFIWALIGSFFIDIINYPFGIFVCILTIAIVIPLCFYTYTKILKKHILWVDILTFIVAILIGMILAYVILISKPLGFAFTIIGIIGCSIFAIMFFVFTLFPPKNFIFKDPISLKYGYEGHPNTCFCHEHHKHDMLTDEPVEDLKEHKANIKNEHAKHEEMENKGSKEARNKEKDE